MADEGDHAAPAADNKVTADSYGNLQIDDADKECWMLRLPPKLAEAWDDLPEGTVLGELVFRKGGKAGPGRPPVKPALEIDVSPELANSTTTTTTTTTTASAPLPLKYSLQAMTKKLPTLHPFTRQPDGSVQIQGKVTRTGNLQVQQDARYRQLCKTRILQTSVHNSRYVKPVESNQVVQQSNKSRPQAGQGAAARGGFGEAIHQYGKRLLELSNNPLGDSLSQKKARFTEDQPTKSVIFQLFSHQQYWTVKDLKVASGGRPETEIRDVLREIGDYHRSGDHKTTWELRKEFQNTSTLASSNAAGGANGGDAAGASEGGGADASG